MGALASPEVRLGQAYLDEVEAGRVQVPIGHVYGFDEIVQAHRDLEEGRYAGKLVVTT